MSTQRLSYIGAIIALTFWGVLLSRPGFAQTETFDTNLKNRGALYYLGEQDELLIKVNIWGFVQKPGQYMVPSGTDLISLISFAGGPREQAKLKNIKVIRNRSLLASRNDPSNRYLAMNGKIAIAPESSQEGTINGSMRIEDQPSVVEVDVKKYLKTGDEDLIPDLQPGDTVVVEGSTFHFISKAFDFATKLAVVAQVYFWIYAARR